MFLYTKKHESSWCGMFFLCIKYILLNLWMMGKLKKNNMLFVKSVFFYLKAEFICYKIDLKYHLVAEEAEIIFFLK